MAYREIKKIEFCPGPSGQMLARFSWSDYDGGSYSKHIYSISDMALPMSAKHFRFFLGLCKEYIESDEVIKGFRDWHYFAYIHATQKGRRKSLESAIDKIEKEMIEMKEVK